MTVRRSLIIPLTLAVVACGGTVTQPGTGAGQQVAVSVQPPSPQVAPGGTVAFAATVTGTANTAVIWSVQEGPSGGAVDGAGLYQAPTTVGTFHVVATSQADTTRSANATVTVGAVTLPAAPSNLVATATSSSGIRLVWTNNATNQTGFRIERSSTSGTTGFAQIATPSSTSYNDSGLTPSTQYWYRVAAVNGAGDSAFSNVATATTQPLGPGAVARPSYNTGAGFFTLNAKLYDANGFEFVMKGTNAGHYDAWWSTCDTNCGTYNSKQNAMRWFIWEMTSTYGIGRTQMVLDTLKNQQIVQMPTCAYGTTNTESTGNGLTVFNACVSNWVATASTHKPYERYSLINIANEWGAGTDGSCGVGRTEWRNAYINAVTTLRNAGYLNTLVIDAGGSGTNTGCIRNHAQAIYDADPQHNIVFSWHAYGETPTSVYTEAAAMAAARTATASPYGGFPVIMGEFGYAGAFGGTNGPLDSIGAAQQAGLNGWLAWSWDNLEGNYEFLISGHTTLEPSAYQSGPAAGEVEFCTTPGPCTTSPCYCTHVSDIPTEGVRGDYGNQVIFDGTYGLYNQRPPKATVF